MNRVIRALQRLSSAAPEARRFAARAFVAAPAVEASLALLGFARTLRWVEAVSAGRSAPAPIVVDITEGERLVAAVYRAHLTRGACLPRSIVQYLLHRRDGLPARLVVGVRRDRGELAAHAWVEDERGPTPPIGFAPLFVTQPGSAA
jgi:hypothetical protein